MSRCAMATTSRMDSGDLSFTYTSEQEQAILTALRQAGLKEDIDQAALLQKITGAARQALV